MGNVGQVFSSFVRRGGFVVGAMAVMVRLGCSGGHPPAEPDAGPDGPNDGPIDGPIDAPGDAPGDAPPDGGPDAPPSTDPDVSGVVNEDGGHQIRQSAVSSFVVTGVNLAGATSVRVGALPATIDSNTATEIRATVYTGYGHALGPVTVTVITPAGTTTQPAALEVTPFVMSPSVTIGSGRGTYESPMHLCDPTLGDPPGYGAGDILELLGGVHRCGDGVVVQSGMTVRGAADGSTIVQGDNGVGFVLGLETGGSQATALRRITFRQPLIETSIFGGGELGELIVEDVVNEASAFFGPAHLSLTRYTFEGSAPLALDLAAATFAASDVTVRCQGGAGDGVLIRRQPTSNNGHGTLTDVTVRGCARGLSVGPLPSPSSFRREVPMVEVVRGELIDNVTGLYVGDGNTTLRDTEIRDDAMTAAPSAVGAYVESGNLTMIGSMISGQRDAGISVYNSYHGGPFEARTVLELDGSEIIGGALGVDFIGANDAVFEARRSIVRDQTVAAVSLQGYDSFFDLGTPADPGSNAFSVTSGVALDDRRSEPTFFNQYVLATGVTLNGNSYAGQTIDGPASALPDYAVRSFGAGLQF